jgi:hypothetical protein
MKKRHADEFGLFLLFMLLVITAVIFVTISAHAASHKRRAHHRMGDVAPTPTAVQGSFYGTTNQGKLSASFSGIAGSPVPGQQAVTGTFYGTITDGRISGAIVGHVTNSPTPTPSPSPVAGLPDLIITSFETNPTVPVADKPVTFSAIVKNQGTAPTPEGVIIGVAFNVDGKEVAWSDAYKTSLAPGASVTLTSNGGPSGSAAWIATSGTHSPSATVDDLNRIKESNKSNNTMVCASKQLAAKHPRRFGDQVGDMNRPMGELPPPPEPEAPPQPDPDAT